MKKPITIQAAATLAAYLIFCFVYMELNPLKCVWTGTTKGDWVLFSDLTGRLVLILHFVLIFLIGGMPAISAWTDYNYAKQKQAS